MPINNLLRTDTLNAAGQLIEYRQPVPFTSYTLTGGAGANLTGGIVVRQDLGDTVFAGLTYEIEYEGDLVYTGGNTITIFGRVLSSTEARQRLFITAQYNGSSWDVDVLYPNVLNQKVIILTSRGGTINIDLPGDYEYVLTGSATLAASWTIQVDPTIFPLSAPIQVRVVYNAALVLNGNNVTIFGKPLTAEQALSGGTIVEVNFDTTVNPNIQIAIVSQTDNVVRVVNKVVATDITSGATITLNPNVDGKYQRLTGSGTLGANVSVATTGTLKDTEGFEVKYEGTFIPNGKTVTIFGVSLTDDDIRSGNVIVRAYYDLTHTTLITEKIYLSTSIIGSSVPVSRQASFETNEVGVDSFTVPFACVLSTIQTCVNKTVAATDDGTITPDINGTPIVMVSAIKITAATAVGASATWATSSANVLAAGDTINITSAKNTAGGRVQLLLNFVRSVTYP